ncbi:DUF2127 domain-containing protein [Nocardioides zeae]
MTYAPDEPALARRLEVATGVGPAWRCLRCGSFVPGPPRGRGPAEQAPVVLRGKLLRDAWILRLLAVDRFVRGTLLLLLAGVLVYFDERRDVFRSYVERDLPSFKPLVDELGIDPKQGVARIVLELFEVSHERLVWITVGIAAYGLLLLLEGVGLWGMRRWGEYVAAAATAAFLPFEVAGLLGHVSLLLLLTFLVNLFLVGYLVWTKRLFGVRGGRRAWDAERRQTSLLEVEEAAGSADG